MAATVEKFLFDTCFDTEAEAAPAAPADEAEAAGPAAAAAAPAHGEAELAAAREEAYAAGRAAGREEAAVQAERALAETLEAIGTRLEELLRARDEAAAAAERRALEAALALVRKLAPELERRHGLAEIEAVVAESLERLREEPRVVVRVADGRLDEVRGRIDELAARCGYPGKVVLLAEPELGAGDVRVEWADGGAERDGSRLWDEVTAALARALPQTAEAADDVAAPAEPQADDGRDDASQSAAAPAATNAT